MTLGELVGIMSMNYWLNIFTGETWEEFRAGGGNIAVFGSGRGKMAKQIQPGDILLCYLPGVMRWVGALAALGPCEETRRVWSDTSHGNSAKLAVRPIVCLDPEQGVPMENLEGLVSFYEGGGHNGKDGGRFKGFFRSSPRVFSVDQDGSLILSLLKDASGNPVTRPVDQKKLGRKSLYVTITRMGDLNLDVEVSVPDREEATGAVPVGKTEPQTEGRLHTEIQYHLLKLGRDMGFDLWVARNDRGTAWNGSRLGEMAGLVSTLPTQFNDVTTRTIELIDVLWLRGNSIAAAFEVECTTSVYSGLLRMSDLLSLQPNLDIRLFIVAPDNRREKVEQEILRPTFRLRDKPLFEVCGFIPYDTFRKKIETIHELKLATALRPKFLEQEAEYFRVGSSTCEMGSVEF